MLRTFYSDVVRGKRRDLTAKIARGALSLARYPYAAGVYVRNRRYDQAHRATHVGRPVISVGNLTLGGTGKTPFVVWLASWLGKRQVRSAIVSRGYGATGGHENDEAQEIHRSIPDVPHVQDPDRIRGARQAIEDFGCSVVVLDDGFQHRRIHRDLDIVLIDATCPFGFGQLFPGGTLREPTSALARADCIVLTRSDMVSPEQRSWIRRQVQNVAPQSRWITARHTPQMLRNNAGATMDVAALRGKRVAGFCGIGNPDSFRRTLGGLGCELVGFREYPDHHAFTQADTAQLCQWAASVKPDFFVCTCKDLVKFDAERLGDWPLWALHVEMQLDAGRDELEAVLEALLNGA